MSRHPLEPNATRETERIVTASIRGLTDDLQESTSEEGGGDAR